MIKQYAQRDIESLDGYMTHVMAMTAEQLHSKSDIAAELAWRDSQIAALQKMLERYSMSAGQADQFAAEAKSVRKALGFAEDAQDVAPIDLLEKIAGLRAEGVERFIHESAYEIPHRIKCGLMNYANQLRSGTHDTADKVGAK